MDTKSAKKRKKTAHRTSSACSMFQNPKFNTSCHTCNMFAATPQARFWLRPLASWPEGGKIHSTQRKESSVLLSSRTLCDITGGSDQNPGSQSMVRRRQTVDWGPHLKSGTWCSCCGFRPKLRRTSQNQDTKRAKILLQRKGPNRQVFQPPPQKWQFKVLPGGEIPQRRDRGEGGGGGGGNGGRREGRFKGTGWCCSRAGSQRKRRRGRRASPFNQMSVNTSWVSIMTPQLNQNLSVSRRPGDQNISASLQHEVVLYSSLAFINDSCAT